MQLWAEHCICAALRTEFGMNMLYPESGTRTVWFIQRVSAILFAIGLSACSICSLVREGSGWSSPWCWTTYKGVVKGLLHCYSWLATRTKTARPCSCVNIHMMQFEFCSPEIIYRYVWAWLLFSETAGVCLSIDTETYNNPGMNKYLR